MTRAAVFWFTGLSGAGKTTIAEGARRRLEEDGYTVLTLDGDAVRNGRHRRLGFGEADVKENNRLIAALCAERRDAGDAILVPIISPYESSRAEARARLGDGFYEIFARAGIATVARRDVKGLYARARRNEITDLIGFSPGTTYEPPQAPDLVLDTASETADRSIERFCAFVRSKLPPPRNGGRQ